MLAAGVTPAAADLTLVGRSSETHGATTVTWDASFEDLGYALGEPVTITVRWAVDAGSARFSSLELRGYTPRGPDPAAGTEPKVISRDDASVRAELRFTDLHVDRERGLSIGNAHLVLVLRVDGDGDGVVETPVALGVNVHVEDPSGAAGPTGPAETEARDERVRPEDPADAPVPPPAAGEGAADAAGPSTPSHRAPPPVAEQMAGWARCVGGAAAAHAPPVPFDPRAACGELPVPPGPDDLPAPARPSR